LALPWLRRNLESGAIGDSAAPVVGPRAVPPADGAARAAHAGTGALLLLVSPSDRHRDAALLARAGFRVIATSRMESSAAQVLNALPTAIAVELIGAFADETFAFVAQLMTGSRQRRVPVVLYGDGATPAQRATMQKLGVGWVQLGDDNRSELAVTVCNGITLPVRRAP